MFRRVQAFAVRHLTSQKLDSYVRVLPEGLQMFTGAEFKGSDSPPN